MRSLSFNILLLILGMTVLKLPAAPANESAALLAPVNPAAAINAAEAAQQPETPAAILPQPGAQNTLDFLNPATLSEAQPAEEARTAIHFLTGLDMSRIESPADPREMFKNVAHPVSVLVYEKCSNSGDAANGSSQCEWHYSSGFTSTMENTHTTQDGVLTSHTLLQETNRERTWTGKRSIHYTAQMEEGKIVSEVYEILYDLGAEENTTDRVMTREVLRYEYTGEGEEKTLKSMSWTKYGNEMNAAPRSIEFHAVLIYDEDGAPLQGFADRWLDGQKEKNLFLWNSEMSALNFTAKELWTMWEKWIRNGPAHVFIV